MKIVYKTVIILLLLLVSSVLIIRVPAVQTYVAGKITGYVNQKTGFDAEITYLNIKWFDEIIVEGVQVRDHHDSLMAAVKRIDADLDFKALIRDRAIIFNSLSIEEGMIHLIKHTDSPEINLALFLKELGKNSRKTTTNGGVDIGQVNLADISLYYDNYDKPFQDLVLDPSHLKLDKIVGKINDLKVSADTISAEISTLSSDLSKGVFRLENLRAISSFTSSSIVLDELLLKTQKSELTGNFKFLFDSITAFRDPLNKLVIDAEIDEGKINMRELSLFANIPDQIVNDELFVSGDLNGPVSRLRGDNVRLQFGDFLNFRADVFIAGLPRIEETFMDIDFRDSNIRLNRFFDKIGRDSVNVPASIARLNYRGKFIGFISDFVAKGNFRTDAGNIYTDINLKINESPEKTAYEGFLSTGSFDLGLAVGDTLLLQKIAFEGSLEGTGLTRESARFYLKSTIGKLGVKGYEYSNIRTDGRFRSQFFNGKLVIEDPNIQMRVDGKINLADNKEEISAKIDMSATNLRNLFLTEKDFIISAESELEISGFGIDRITGVGKINNLSIINEQDSLEMEEVSISLKRVNEDRIVQLESTDIRAELSGNFELSQLLPDITTLARELKLELENDSTAITEYYANLPDFEENSYSLQFSIEVEDPNEYLNPFVENLYISEEISLYGGFNKGTRTDLSMNFATDSVHYRNMSFTNSFVSLSIAKESKLDKVYSQLEIYSDEQYWTGNLETRNLRSVWSWEANRIGFGIAVNPPDSSNALDLNGDIVLKDQKMELQFDSSVIKLRDHLFDFNRDHFLSFQWDSLNQEVRVGNLELSDGIQALSADGSWSMQAASELAFRLKDIDVSELSPFVKREIEGTANGQVKLQSDTARNNFFTGNVIVSNLFVDEFLVGDLIASTTWNKSEEKLLLDFNIVRKGVNSIKVVGDVFLKKEGRILDLVAKFDGAQVNILEPYIQGVVSDLKGELTGQLNIDGKLEYPLITGEARLEKCSLLVDYLKTRYNLNGKLVFRQDKILLQDIRGIDYKGNKAFASGEIVHNGFQDLFMDVKANVLNFNVLNTNRRDNDLFYGEAYASGDISFFGTPTNLKISANAVTNKNTRIFIPLSEETSSDVKDYISFVDYSDTLTIRNGEKEGQDLKGLELDFVLDVTPDAYFELIFDINSGDIIRGRGNGDIKLTVNTEGDFSMFGDYEISEGGYNFTLYNIINKEFNINPGSKISWYGDPYKAILDIEARYSQLVSLAPLVRQENVNTRSNAIVKLFLDGEMLSPDINFDIEIEDYPLEYSIYVESFKSRIRADKQDLNRQVFSLLILKKLFEEENFVASEAIGVSVSEFVSNQLSYWITQVDDNLEIDVDFSNLDEDAFNAFQLRLSYKFLDGRLRVTRGGGFGTVSPDGNNDNNAIGSIIGDLTLEYLLTPDGKLRVKMFTRNNRNAFEDNYSFETGASLRYVRSFDYLKEIWQKNQVKKVKFVNEEGEVVKGN